MPVVRINKTQNYTAMSNYHFKENKMSLKAKGLLSLMLSLPDDWDYSIAGLVAICKENETAIKSTLKELQAFGYLKISKLMPDKDKNRARIEYIYDIFECPQDGEKQEVENLQAGKKQEVENLHPENLHIENLHTENLSLENPIQLNTKELNTKELSTKELNTNNKKESKKEKAAQKSFESIKKNDDDNKRVLAFEKSSPKKQKPFNELIDAYTDNEDLRFELKEHLKTRKAKRATLSNRAIELSLKKLDEIGDTNAQKIKIVQNAIMNGWTSFYPLKDDYGYKTKPKTDPGDGKVTWADFPNASDADRICMTPETYKRRIEALENMEWDRTGGVF